MTWTSSPAPQPDARRQSGQTVRIGARIDAEEFYRLLEGQVIDDTNLFSQNSKSGRTTTTTIAPTAPSAARPPANAYGRKPTTRCTANEGDRASGKVRASPTAFTSPDYVAITAIPARG